MTDVRYSEEVQSVGCCGAFSPDERTVCILPRGHSEPHGWEPEYDTPETVANKMASLALMRDTMRRHLG